MSADLLVLRDYVERGLMAFDIPYHYLSGEVMEAQIPATYQPLFGGCKSLKLGFEDTGEPSPSVQTVTHGAQVLDALFRLLEGDRNTIGHALIARKILPGEVSTELEGRLTILNARILRTEPAVVYHPVVRIEFRMRAFTRDGLRSQSVPVFYDADKGRVVDGTRYANLRTQDAEESIGGGERRGLKTPAAGALVTAATAAAEYLRRTLPPLEPLATGEPARIHLCPERLLVLHDPRPGVHITVAERSTQREYAYSFPVSDDRRRIASTSCAHCGRIKTHYYVSHRTGDLICTDCSLLCVGCWDAYPLDAPNCALCTKRRYCPGCLDKCGECGLMVCRDHRHKDLPSDRVCCQDCPPPAGESRASGHGASEAAEAPGATRASAPEPESGLEEDIFDADGGGGEEAEGEATLHALDPTRPDPASDVDFLLDGDVSEDASDPGDDLFSLMDAASRPFADAAEASEPDGDEDDFWGDDPEPDEGRFAEEPAAEAERPAPRTVRRAQARTAPAGDADLDHPSWPADEAEEETDPGPADDPEEEVEEVPAATAIRPSRARDPETVNCACHGEPRPVNALRMDFLSGRYYCPGHVEPCSNCGQATALDFLEGDPALCFYCANRMPLNLDPEAEEIFKREVQHVLPIKYRLGNCRVARSPHHLAYYLKPMLGKEIILYWDRWTDALLDDNQFG